MKITAEPPAKATTSRRSRQVRMLRVLAVALGVAALLSLSVGPTGVTLEALPRAAAELLGYTERSGSHEALVLFNIRLPRMLMAVLVGASLAVSGALMQGLSTSPEQQQRVRVIAETAARRNVQTVAERIEDANTMAVVWQLGVQYIQGYLVHAPEEVVLKS